MQHQLESPSATAAEGCGCRQSPPKEVARPEMPMDSAPAAGQVDEEEWVNVFGPSLSLLVNNSLNWHVGSSEACVQGPYTDKKTAAASQIEKSSHC